MTLGIRHDQLAELKGESKGCDVADDAPKQRREPTQSTFLEGAAVPKNVGNQTDRFLSTTTQYK
jgi:hypothetical protein